MHKYEYKVIRELIKLKPDEDVTERVEAYLNYWGDLGWRIFKLDVDALGADPFKDNRPAPVQIRVKAVAARRVQTKEDPNWKGDPQCL